VLDLPVDLHVGGEEFLCTQCHTLLKVMMSIEVVEPTGRTPKSAGPAPVRRIVAAFRGEASLEVVKELLSSAEFEVLTATTGRDALRLVDQATPALVIVEDVLSDLSGLDLCELLKRSKRHPGLKVMLITAGRAAGEGMEESSLLYGPDARLARSSLYKSLVDRVRALVQQPTSGRGGESPHARAAKLDPDATRLMSDPSPPRPLSGR
jgi:DNA-binding response OmpR family regulator